MEHLEDRARSMRDAGVQEQRRGMLNLPHIAPLTAYVSKLRQREGVQVPNFDPLDGGVEAQALFLFEKPGPRAAEFGDRKGSGFISRDNDDATAEACLDFMEQARIPRKVTVIWNVVPWWNGTRKVTATEVRDGAICLRDLTGLLPKLRVAVMVGRKAAEGLPWLKTTGLQLFTSDHPGPLVRARWPERWKAIPSEWAKIREFLDMGPS